MTEKLGILVPLQTLPYWEPAENPTILLWLGVMIGLPAVLFVLITLLVRAKDLGRAFRSRDVARGGAFWIHAGSASPASLDSSEDETPFTVGEREGLGRAAVRAERETGLRFSVFVGPTPSGTESADFAEGLHESLAEPDRTVLIVCDPEGDDLEFVLGEAADRLIDDGSIAQAAMAIEAGRANHWTINSLTGAVDQIAGQARRPKVLHADRIID